MEIAQTFNAFKTVNEMLSDRGYSIETKYHPAGNHALTIEEFKVMYENGKYDLVAKRDAPNANEINVCFLNKQDKISVNMIREKRKSVAKKYKDDESTVYSIMYILKEEPNNNIHREMATEDFLNDEIFTIAQLTFNITKHVLVPKHIHISDEEEKKEIFKTFKCKEGNLPKVFKTDPVSKYFGAKSGDIFKIIRYSPDSGVSIYFRAVK